MSKRIPAEAFPPGEFLKDELEERGWTQTEFASITGLSTAIVNQILVGRRGITPESARAIGAALGTDPMFWMNLESAYRLWKAGPADESIARRAKLREEFPVRDLVKRGWVAASDDAAVLEHNVFRFYGITSAAETPPLAAAAKRSNYEAPFTRNQQAWVLRVREIARSVTVATYREQLLREKLDELHRLTSDAEEVRHVVKILAECGVRLVIVEPLPGSKIDGVCLWLDAKSPVVGMSLRLDRIDNFWFVLRHELEHVLRKDGDCVDVDIDSAADTELPPEERAANEVAAEFCVPQEELSSWIARVRPIFSDERLRGFSERLGIHPGIIAGQLRKRINRWDIFQKHLVKVRHIVTRVAITDGYGHENLEIS